MEENKIVCETLGDIICTWQSIANFFKMSPRTIRHWHKTKPMPVFKIGGTTAILKQDLINWVMRWQIIPTKDHQYLE